jgi:5,5'-dehydrodivanillate O-demethylase
LGEGEAPPLRRHPDFERSGFIETGLPELWPCNYFNRLDNACDVGHVSFTHRESAVRAKRADQLAIRQVAAEETGYGIKTAVVIPGKLPFYTHLHMPNTNQTRSRVRIEGSLKDAESGWVDRLFWRVPVDDERCVSFVVDWMPLTGQEARQYRERRHQARAAMTVSGNELGAAVLAGKMRVKDLDPNMSTYYLFWVEDYVTQVGQGTIPDRSQEHLGRVDVGVILMRKIWQRELAALAEGRALTQWSTPSGLADMSAQ